MLARVKDINAIMEEHFPLDLAESWDNSGFQLGSKEKPVVRVAVALDLNEEILNSALQQNMDMIITHHPLIFQPVKRIDFDRFPGDLIKRLIQADMAVYSAHTNLDAAENGLNQILAEKLGLSDIKPLYRYKSEPLLKIVVFVPDGHAEKVREALCEAGAGFVGRYSDCTFSAEGLGTFKPHQNTRPFIGSEGVLEEVKEVRLETIVYQRDLQAVLAAMKAVHPYEEVAYDIYRLENEGKAYSMGRTGLLAQSATLGSFAEMVKEALGIDHVRVVGNMSENVHRAAVVGGAGASLINRAVERRVDVLVTGDIKYHEAQECLGRKLAVIDAGHQGTEEIICSYLCRLLGQACRQRGFETSFAPLYAGPCFQVI